MDPPEEIQITLNYSHPIGIQKVELTVYRFMTLEHIKETVESKIGDLADAKDFYHKLLTRSSLRDIARQGDRDMSYTYTQTAEQIDLQKIVMLVVELKMPLRREKPDFRQIAVHSPLIWAAFKVQFTPNHTIRSLKQYLEPILGLSPDQQLITQEDDLELEDTMTVGDCDMGHARKGWYGIIVTLREESEDL